MGVLYVVGFIVFGAGLIGFFVLSERDIEIHERRRR